MSRPDSVAESARNTRPPGRWAVFASIGCEAAASLIVWTAVEREPIMIVPVLISLLPLAERTTESAVKLRLGAAIALGLWFLMGLMTVGILFAPGAGLMAIASVLARQR
jgi:hypothetical protein